MSTLPIAALPSWSLPNHRLHLTGVASEYNDLVGLEPVLRGQPATELFTFSKKIMTTPKKTILPPHVIRSAETTPLPPEDAIAIHELLNRVYLAEDTRDPVALKQLVAEDFVQSHAVFGQLEGQDAFAEWVISNPQLFDGIRHQAINTVTSGVDETTALAVGYLIVTQLFSDDESVAATLPKTHHLVDLPDETYGEQGGGLYTLLRVSHLRP